jgi:hypothetical protein
MDSRRTTMKKWMFLTSSNIRTKGEAYCNLKATFLFSTQTNKQMTDDFHSLKIRRFETGGASFF